MSRRRSMSLALVVCCAALLFITVPAYAYIDPNAAGLISQIITPLLVAAAAALTVFRKQMGALFSSLTRRFRRGADV